MFPFAPLSDPDRDDEDRDRNSRFRDADEVLTLIQRVVLIVGAGLVTYRYAGGGDIHATIAVLSTRA